MFRHFMLIVLIANITLVLGEWWFRNIGNFIQVRDVDLFDFESSTWHYMCVDEFTADKALVACRTIGHENVATAWYYRTCCDDCRCTTAEAYRTGSSCKGSESSLEVCGGLYIANWCFHGAVGVLCDPVWNYRLNTTTDALEMRPTDSDTLPQSSPQWSEVCIDNFALVDALVVCNSFKQGTFSYPAYFPSATSSVRSDMLTVSCTGNEPSVQKCFFDRITCKYAPVGLICDPKWEYRINAATNALEVRPSTGTPWGHVCLDQFTMVDALVACRSIGIGNVTTAWYFETYSPNNKSFCRNYSYTSPTYSCGECSGIESSLNICGLFGSTTCSRCSVSVICDPKWEYRINAATNVLEVRPNNVFNWGHVCSRGFAVAEALVACRSVGITSVAHVLVFPSFPPISNMSKVNCTGTELSLKQCSVDYDLCDGAASVICDPKWEYRINAATNILEVRPNNVISWGHVCSRRFTVAEALVACRSVGITSVADVLVFPIDSLGSYMNDFQCAGNESSLSTCRLDFFTTCDASVGVVCDPKWEYSLTASDVSTKHTGQQYTLWVRPNHLSQWGTVCADGFTAADARVACRSVGFSRALAAPFSTNCSFGMQQYTYMRSVSCVGNESSLAECHHLSTSCYSFGRTCVATVSCYSDFEFRIGARDELQVRPIDPNGLLPDWGTVCSAGFTDASALVACQTVGFIATTAATFFPESAASTTAINYLRNVNCTGNESSLTKCPFDYSSTCDTSVGVVCDPKWEYRINPATKVLEARPSVLSEWGTVCSTGFNVVDALVACRSVGLWTTLGFSEATRSSPGGFRMMSKNCSGSEMSLSDCGLSMKDYYRDTECLGVMPRCGKAYEAPPPSGTLFVTSVVVVAFVFGVALVLQIACRFHLFCITFALRWQSVTDTIGLVLPIVICSFNAALGPNLRLCDASIVLPDTSAYAKYAWECAVAGLVCHFITAVAVTIVESFVFPGWIKSWISTRLLQAPRPIAVLASDNALAVLLLLFYPNLAYFSSIPYGETCINDKYVAMIKYFVVVQMTLFGVTLLYSILPIFASLCKAGSRNTLVLLLKIMLVTSVALGPSCFLAKIVVSAILGTRSFQDFTISFSVTFVFPCVASLLRVSICSSMAAAFQWLVQLVTEGHRASAERVKPIRIESSHELFRESVLKQQERGSFEDFVTQLISMEILVPFCKNIFQRKMALKYQNPNAEVRRILEVCESYARESSPPLSSENRDDQLICALLCVSQTITDDKGQSFRDILTLSTPLKNNYGRELTEEQALVPLRLHRRIQSALVPAKNLPTENHYCLITHALVNNAAIEAVSGDKIHFTCILLLNRTIAKAVERASSASIPSLSLVLVVTGPLPRISDEISCLAAGVSCQIVHKLQIGTINLPGWPAVHVLTVRVDDQNAAGTTLTTTLAVPEGRQEEAPTVVALDEDGPLLVLPDEDNYSLEEPLLQMEQQIEPAYRIIEEESMLVLGNGNSPQKEPLLEQKTLPILSLEDL